MDGDDVFPYEAIPPPTIEPSQVFLQSLVGEVKKEDVYKMVDSQQHMYVVFQTKIRSNSICIHVPFKRSEHIRGGGGGYSLGKLLHMCGPQGECPL